jgi:phosphoglucosamine mutase
MQAQQAIGLEQVVSTQALIERQLGMRGRVLLRASGTEPVVRVMVEADDAALALDAATQLADSVRSALSQSQSPVMESI